MTTIHMDGWTAHLSDDSDLLNEDWANETPDAYKEYIALKHEAETPTVVKVQTRVVAQTDPIKDDRYTDDLSPIMQVLLWIVVIGATLPWFYILWPVMGYMWWKNRKDGS